MSASMSGLLESGHDRATYESSSNLLACTTGRPARTARRSTAASRPRGAPPPRQPPATTSVIEMESQHRRAVPDRGADAIGILPEHEPGQPPIARFGLDDLLYRRPFIGKLERRAAIADPHIEVEFVEARLDRDRPPRLAVFADGLDRLVDGECDADHHVRARAPAPS